jgi:hypothetical protein
MSFLSLTLMCREALTCTFEQFGLYFGTHKETQIDMILVDHDACDLFSIDNIVRYSPLHDFASFWE